MIKHFVFPDHHVFKEGEIQKIISQCQPYKILITDKDAVKIQNFSFPNHYFWKTLLRLKMSEKMDQIYEQIVNLVS